MPVFSATDFAEYFASSPRSASGAPPLLWATSLASAIATSASLPGFGASHWSQFAADSPSRGPTKTAKPLPSRRESARPIWFASGESQVSMKSVPKATSTSAAPMRNCGTASLPKTSWLPLRSDSYAYGSKRSRCGAPIAGSTWSSSASSVPLSRPPRNTALPALFFSASTKRP